MPLCSTSGSCCKEIKKTDVINDKRLKVTRKNVLCCHITNTALIDIKLKQVILYFTKVYNFVCFLIVLIEELLANVRIELKWKEAMIYFFGIYLYIYILLFLLN